VGVLMRLPEGNAVGLDHGAVVPGTLRPNLNQHDTQGCRHLYLMKPISVFKVVLLIGINITIMTNDKS
jgi:hypothetical protein